MKMKVFTTSFMALALASFTANAEYQQTTTSEESLESLTEIQSGELDDSLDNEITNARMRAESGSQSKLSMSASLAYSGGALNDPLSNERPNIYGNAEEETRTDLGGRISARYRLSARDSLSFGVGVEMLTPFESGRESQVDNPSIGYSRFYRVGNFQTSTSVSMTQATADNLRAANIERTYGFSHNMMTQIGNSGFTAGASVGLTAYEYSDGSTGPGDQRPLIAAGFYPQLEYTFNDTYSFRTVFGYFNVRNYRGDDNITDLTRVYEYQSVGLGISLTRDIYLYPNVQFLVDDLDVDKTNVALSATINLF